MKKIFSMAVLVFSAVILFGQASDLFFSEYIEGGSNNKAIELYNGTGATIDLSNYLILQTSNGGNIDEYVDQLSGMLADGAVYVIAHSSSVSDILNVADTTGTGICYHNGDDARALAKIDPTGTDTVTFMGSPVVVTILDYIGEPGPDPGSGWSVAGVSNGTQNHTLVRKSSVTGGNTSWTLSAGTTTADSEWEVYAQDEFAYLGAHTYGIQQVTVTINVNMTYQTTLGNFNPLVDFVDVAGSMNSWGGTVMTDTDGDNIWSIDLTGVDVGTLLEYKFRINGTSWESVGNRNYTAVLGTNVVDHWYDDNAGPQNVTFTIDDGTASYLDIEMKGSFDSWVLHQMYDDGTNGDLVSGDHIWTVVLSIPGGTWEWGAIENDGSTWGLWLIDGSNPQFSVNTDGTVTGVTDYVIPAPGNEDVVFNVNMNQQITLGNFDPLVDFVDVAGNFNGFGGSAAMTDVDADGIYTITIGSFVVGASAEFKFRINGTGWETMPDNRAYTVIGGGVDIVTYWFNNLMPPLPPGLFFSEYIEGSSNNKALEIYNGTGSTVNLDNYRIAQASNGGGWAYYHSFPAGATLAAGDVWVLLNSSTDTTLFDYANADEILSYPSAVHHNGDDARAIVSINGSDTTLLDVIGDPDNDPGTGWAVAGVSTATKDHTLVRKATVTAGNTNWTMSAGTNATDAEWVVLDINTMSYLGSHPHSFVTQEDLTLHVDMNYQNTLGNFNPLVDFVDVAGSFNAWAGSAAMDDTDGDGIYTIVIPSLYVDTIYNYKFRINGTNWENMAMDRQHTMVTGINELSHVFNNDAGPVMVTFTVTDLTTVNVDIELKGSFDNWNLHQMYDDGTNGDVTAADNIWTVVLSITSGSWEWGAIENDGSPNGLWLIDGSNLQFMVGSGAVSGQFDYTIPAPGNEDVIFNVNMNYQTTLGNFDPLVDFVDIAGSFNGWGGSAAMDDTDGDGIYSLTVSGFIAGNNISFKFRINGTNWEYISDRTYSVIGGGVDVYTAWFNDEMPPVPDDLFFSEYIEGSSNNKALEVYNGTGAAVSLDDYRIGRGNNGQGWLDYHTFPAGATLADGAVWVMVADQISATYYDTTNADEILSYPSVCHHNGDDARGLFKVVGVDTTLIDLFGDPDNDPGTGWDAAGVTTATANHTMVRKSTINTGNTDWVASFGTTEENSEWVVLDQNEFQYLGSHPHVFNDLFFSEYIEGSSNNKGYEIYNGTGMTVNLDDYIIAQASNGNGWAYYHNFPAGATLADGDVWVIVADAVSATYFDTTNADEVLSYPSVTHHNGDDARALCKVTATDTLIIDLIGDPDNDPGSGWDVAGVAAATANHTLVRKGDVVQGNADWLASAGTDALNSEWVVLDQNEFMYLGSHPHTFAQLADVTFNVNMSHYVTLGVFDPILDYVDVAGTMNGWSGGDTLYDPDGDLIYSLTLIDQTVTDVLEFKFRINGSWNDNTAEFPFGGPNRVYTVVAGVNVVDYWYNDLFPSVPIYDIQFTTDSLGNSPYLGEIVTTGGIVTAVYPGAYAIQDGTGMWTGIYVYDGANVVARGDSVEVTGTVAEYYSLTEINAVTLVTIINSGNPVPAPAVISTMAAGSMEGWEGVLVEVQNAACTAVENNYGEWYVDDGSGDCQVDDAGYSFSPTLGNLYNVTGMLNFGFGAFEILPRDSADVLDVTPLVDIQTLNLLQGWSIISTYIDPYEALCDSVFSTVVNDVILFKNWNGLVYWPLYNLNAIGNIVIGEGYQLNMASAQTIDIEGTAVVPENTPISIPQGWSIIGYLRDTPADIVGLMSNIVSDVIIVKNWMGLVYWPLYNLNAIGNMNPGEGYQTKLTTAQVLTYPANGAFSKANITSVTPQYYENKLNTGANMTIGIPADSWNVSPNIGDEVAVFGANGMMVGGAVYTGGNLAIAAWGDNELSSEVDGLLAGESFTLKVYNKFNRNETELLVYSWSGDESYKNNGIAVAEKVSLANSEAAICYPNPASNYTTVGLTVNNDQNVRVNIYNSIGILVKQVQNGSMQAGEQTLEVDLSEFNTGLYFFRIEANDKVETLTFEVLR